MSQSTRWLLGLICFVLFGCSKITGQLSDGEVANFRGMLDLVADSSVIYRAGQSENSVLLVDITQDFIAISPVPFEDFSDLIFRYEVDDVQCFTLDDTTPMIVTSTKIFEEDPYNSQLDKCPDKILERTIRVPPAGAPPYPPSNFEPQVFIFKRATGSRAEIHESYIGNPFLARTNR